MAVYGKDRDEMMEMILTELAPVLDADAYHYAWKEFGKSEAEVMNKITGGDEDG